MWSHYPDFRAVCLAAHGARMWSFSVYHPTMLCVCFPLDPKLLEGLLLCLSADKGPEDPKWGAGAGKPLSSLLPICRNSFISSLTLESHLYSFLRAPVTKHCQLSGLEQ